MISADLHIHSTSSDGSTLSFNEIIQTALKNKIGVIAITNYDVITEKKTIIENIIIITAGEFYCKNHDEIKILAYDLIDNSNIFNNYSENIKKARLIFFYNCFRSLNKEEISLFKADFYNFINTTKNSSVLNHFKSYRDTYWDAKKLITEIHACRGIAILSCPFYIKDIDTYTEEIVKCFIVLGIDGIECYHPKVNSKLRDKLIDLCNKYDILISGGSNFSKYGGEIGKVDELSLNNELLTICKKFNN